MNKIEKSLETIAEGVLELAGASLSPATRRAYTADWGAFELFCKAHSLTPLPAEPLTICMYVSAVKDTVKTVTVTRALTAITKVHELQGHISPCKSPQVKTVVRGLKNTRGSASEKAAPIAWGDLLNMIRLCPPSMAGIRDKSILGIGWAGALRRSEIVALDIGDLTFDDNGLRIAVRRSKTDPDGKGREIGIPVATEGGGLCVVALAKNWVRRLENARGPRDESPALFRNLGSKGRQFWSPVGSRLGDRSVSLIVRKYAALAGLKGAFSGHSLRRGLATEAARVGVPEYIIQQHTGHASIDMVREYIDAGRIWIDNPLLPIIGAR